MNERLYIKEMKQELQYRDRRSIHRWCCNNDVRILCDIGSNRRFVLKAEFENAKSKNYKMNLLNSNSSIQTLVVNRIKKIKEVNEYKPQGEIESNFLSILQNLDRTL